MGLFSSEKKTYVGTSISRVIQDNLIPDAVRSGVLEALFSDGDTTESINLAITSGIAVKADQMYKYGRDHYTHGLPSGQTKGTNQGRAEVKTLLDSIEGSEVTMEYCHLGAPNLFHIARSKIITTLGYVESINRLGILSTQIGSDVYLEDLQLVVSPEDKASISPSCFVEWGTLAAGGFTPERGGASPEFIRLLPPNSIILGELGPASYMAVSYQWQYKGNIYKEVYKQTLEGFDKQADYFQVKYTAAGVVKYWSYKAGLGTYPTLDAVFTSPPVTTGTYFPFIHFRSNRVSESSNPYSDSYKTTKKLVKYLGIDFDQLATGINENPDIDSVEQALIMMAVPANTQNAAELQYLFSFFDSLYYSGSTRYVSEAEATQAALFAQDPNLMRRSIIIQDGRFKMAISNSGIYKKTVKGVLGPVGKHTFVYGTTEVPDTYIDQDTMLPVVIYNTKGTHTYRKQITLATYEEILVVNMNQLYFVTGNYFSLADEQDEILMIPLDRSITETYKTSVKEEIYSRSLHYVFTSVQVVKVKWYQTSFFSFLMLAIAVVVTISTMGSDGGALISAVLAGNTAAAVIAATALLKSIVIGYVIGLVIKQAVKVIGMEAAFILAIVAAVTAAKMTFTAGSLSGAPWAADLLRLSTGLTKGIKDLLAEDFRQLSIEYTELGLIKSESEKQLEEANKLLESSVALNPFVIFGESPNDYYNRTVHAGNVGILGFNAIESYVDIALTLPKLEDTLGENKYG